MTGSDAKTDVFVMLPLNIVNSQNNGVNYEKTDDERTGKEYEKLPATARPFRADLDCLRKAGVKGVMVDCWWGIVEAEGPGQYNWNGYDRLFSIVCDAGLDLHVVMSFHANGDDNPLPNWVKRIGKREDLFYKDADGNQSPEYLSWAVDQELVLKDRYGNPVSPLQVYENFMSKFRESMDKYFKKSDENHGSITMIEVGLGPSGELRYPAYRFNSKPITQGIGAFQCYDKYMMKSWDNEAEEKKFTIPCRVGPQTAGSYNSTPDQTQFFQDQDQTKPALTNGICYWDEYGKAFLTWYSKNLVDHGKRVLQIAKEIFMPEGVNIAAKVPGIHWYYDSLSHAAEATAGLFAGDPKDNLYVYKSIADTLESLKATFIFTCAEMKDDSNNITDTPHKLVVEVLGVAEQSEVSRACENASAIAYKNASPEDELSSYNRIISVAIQYNISYFTYLRLDPELIKNATSFELFKKFVKGMNAHTLIESPEEASPSAAQEQ